MKVNIDLSKAMQAEVMAEDKDCFINAFRTVSHLPGEGIYVEGYALIEPKIFPVFHGWVEFEGEIVEPTPIYLNHADTTEYFPGWKIPARELWRIANKKRSVPFAAPHELERDDIRAAYIEATRKLMGPNAETFLRLHPWYREQHP